MPTARAMKAAKVVCDGFYENPKTIDYIAKLIDRAVGIPEMEAQIAGFLTAVDDLPVLQRERDALAARLEAVIAYINEKWTCDHCQAVLRLARGES